MQSSAAAGGSEIAKAKEAVCERGNKLNEVEEKTEQMVSEAKVGREATFGLAGQAEIILRFGQRNWT